jgi:iron complex transport system permease protein
VRRRFVLRLAPPDLSLRFDVRVMVVLGIALAATFAAFVVGVGYGDFPISPGGVLATLVGQGSPEQELVVLTLRLPRVLVAILVGAAFALSGAILQSLSQNPLVAPDVIGINAGAALVAVSVIVLGFPGAMLAPGAMLGAFAAAALVYGLAYRRGLSQHRLVLVGIAVNAALAAGVSFLLTRGEILEVQRATVWLIGSVYSADWGDVRTLSIALGILLVAALLLGHQLEALQLGDDLARGLGARVERVQLALALVAVILAALAVSVAGPIAFVAFVAPHIARRLARSSGTGSLAACAAVGAVLVLASDLAAQHAFGSVALPVGIVTAVIGAPYFLLLLQRAGRLGTA